jgi:putative Holliday junction resolvase
MARWLGIDHGGRRIGVALGDDQAKFASPIAQLSAQDPALFAKIAAIMQEYGAIGIVVGWPINDDDSEGPQALLARQFAVDLAGATLADVRLWDERLSSFEADDKLKGLFTRGQKRQRHDAVAAAAFLGDFLTGDGPARAVKVEPKK